MVVGEEGTNGGLWCSPVANTSRPISSALRAIATIALMRSCSVGVRPVMGSVVTSPTVKIPNCMAAPAVLVPGPTGPLRCSIYLKVQLLGGERIFRGLSCREALDDTEPEPIGLLDAKAEIADAGERPAPEMLAGQRDRDPFVEPLDRAQRQRAGDHVINEQEAAAGPQHTG